MTMGVNFPMRVYRSNASPLPRCNPGLLHARNTQQARPRVRYRTALVEKLQAAVERMQEESARVKKGAAEARRWWGVDVQEVCCA